MNTLKTTFVLFALMVGFVAYTQAGVVISKLYDIVPIGYTAASVIAAIGMEYFFFLFAVTLLCVVVTYLGRFVTAPFRPRKRRRSEAHDALPVVQPTPQSNGQEVDDEGAAG